MNSNHIHSQPTFVFFAPNNTPLPVHYPPHTIPSRHSSATTNCSFSSSSAFLFSTTYSAFILPLQQHKLQSTLLPALDVIITPEPAISLIQASAFGDALSKIHNYLEKNFSRYKPIPIDYDAPAVRVDNLSKMFKYSTKDPKTKKRVSSIRKAVDDVSFTVNRGEIFGLLGPNASGKTTTLKCIATLLKPHQGNISIFGIDALNNASTSRRLIGYVAQGDGVDKVLTGREHLELFGNLHHMDKKSLDSNIEELIEILNLGPYIDNLTGTYSGGIKRRLDVALGVLHQPPILILDEPTAGLDTDSRAVIWELLQTYRDNGGTVILTSHYLEEVDVLSQNVVIMDQGKIIASGRPSELKAKVGRSRITIRLKEFTKLDEANLVLDKILESRLVTGGLINKSLGNAIELVVEDEKGTAIGIPKFLESIGYSDIFSFSQSKPSLGDVYLAVTGRTMQEADMIGRQSRDSKTEKKENMR